MKYPDNDDRVFADNWSNNSPWPRLTKSPVADNLTIQYYPFFLIYLIVLSYESFVFLQPYLIYQNKQFGPDYYQQNLVEYSLLTRNWYLKIGSDNFRFMTSSWGYKEPNLVRIAGGLNFCSEWEEVGHRRNNHLMYGLTFFHKNKRQTYSPVEIHESRNESLRQLVVLGFDVTVFTPAAYQRRSLRRPSWSSHLAAGFCT